MARKFELVIDDRIHQMVDLRAVIQSHTTILVDQDAQDRRRAFTDERHIDQIDTECFHPLEKCIIDSLCMTGSFCHKPPFNKKERGEPHSLQRNFRTNGVYHASGPLASFVTGHSIRVSSSLSGTSCGEL